MRRKYLFYTLAFLSGAFTSLMVAMDIWISAKLIPDIWIFGISILWAGVYIHAFLLPILSLKIYENRPIGHFIDPLFKGVFVPSGKVLHYLIIASLGNAIASLTYFFLIDIMPDPSAVLPFSSVVIIYLIIGDMIIEKESPSIAEIEGLFMILIGVILVSFSRGRIDPISLLLVLGPMNFGSFLYNYGQRKAKIFGRKIGQCDSINFRFWSLLFTTLIFSLLLLIFYISPQIVLLGIYYSVVYFLPLAIDMVITFFAAVFYIRALGMGKMSIVNALSSTSVVIGLPLTLVLSFYFPEVYKIPEMTGLFLYLRSIGVILVFLGIIGISLSEVTAYILIRSRPGYSSKLLEEIIRIRGVESVAAIVGRYDFIVRVRTRAYSKAYDTVLRKIIQLEGIEDVHWVSVLKEWERI